MINNSAVNFVETNVSNTKDFSIKASAKAFKILSSGIYQDKIKAVIRELSCNAYDAHVAAGNQDTPFDVHMPTQLEPWFSVRDYGIGMDDAKIKKLYTTYFDSTKDQSNDFIGALGIGSKSPFSYTDSYTVTAFSGTEKRIYSCFIGEDGTPAIAQLGKEKSTEPRGIEVSLAVKSEDFRKFHDASVEVYYYFNKLPSGFTYCEKTFNTQAIQLAEHISYIPKNYSYDVDISFRMGQIVYPIKVKDLNIPTCYVTKDGVSHPYNAWNILESAAKRKKIIIDVAIGEIDMTASREELEITKNTLAAIHKYFAILTNTFVDDWVNAVENAESYGEALITCFGFNHITELVSPSGYNLKWKSAPMNDSNKVYRIARALHLETLMPNRMTTKSINQFCLSLLSKGRGKNLVIIKDKTTVYNFKEALTRYVNDNISLESTAFYNKWNETHKVPFDSFMGVNVFVMTPYCKHIDLAKKIMDYLGIKYVYASALPKIEKIKEAKTEPKKTKYISTLTSCTHHKPLDFAKGGWYVKHEDYKLNFDQVKLTNPSELSIIFKDGGQLNGVNGADLWVLGKADEKAALNSGAIWLNYMQYRQAFIDELLNECETTRKDDIVILETANHLQNILPLSALVSLYPIYPELKVLMGKYKDLSLDTCKELGKLRSWYESYKSINCYFVDRSYIDMIEVIIDKNPILTLFTKSSYSIDKAHLVKHYLKPLGEE